MKQRLLVTFFLSLWQCPNSCPPGRSGYPGLPGMRVRIMSVLYSIFMSIIYTKNRGSPWSTDLARAQTTLWWIRQVCIACPVALSVVLFQSWKFPLVRWQLTRQRYLAIQCFCFSGKKYQWNALDWETLEHQMKVQKFTPIVRNRGQGLYI